MSRIDVIGQNGNTGEHYMTQFCKDCKSFKRKTFTMRGLFRKVAVHTLPLEVGVCTDTRQEMPLKYLVTGDTDDMAYATVVRGHQCKGDWYER